MSATSPPSVLPAPAATRTHLALRRSAGAAAVLLGLGLGLLPPLVLGWFDDELGGAHRVHVVSMGAHGLLIVLALVAISRRPTPGALQMLVAATVPMPILVAIGGDSGPAIAALVIFGGLDAVMIALWGPQRREVADLGDGLSPLLVPLTLFAAVPLTRFAAHQIDIQQLAGHSEPHGKAGHWSGEAVLAIALVLVAVVASLRTRGGGIAVAGASSAAVVVGLASIVHPEHASSFGRDWGAASVAGGVAFALAGAWEARRLRRTGTRPIALVSTSPQGEPS